MKRRIVLATVLCLAVAALGIAAAPALAADGCTCHTAVPPTATAAHTPFVASVVDCTTCHVDWVVPHPDSGASTLLLSGRSTAAGYRLRGWLGVAFGGLTPTKKPHPDVVVYLQQRLWGATQFTDLAQVTTDASGNGVFTVASPPAFATYRAVSRGHDGVSLFSDATALFRPRVTTLLPTPELTVEVRGFRAAPLSRPSLPLGRALRVKGTVAPADLGGKVSIRVQKRVVHGWLTRITVQCAISATGTYSSKFTPKHTGTYRVFAVISATAAHGGVQVRWAQGNGDTFTVR